MPYKATRMEEYSAFCALWRTDLSFHSTITVSNQLANTGIDAIPTLYMADGTQWELPAIHLGKSGVQDLDINQALSNAPDGIRAHLSSYGSAAIRYRYDWQGAVYATMSIVDLTRSLSHVYPFVFPPDQGIRENISPKTRAYRDAINGIKYEGLWFRKTHNTGGFLALANTSSALLNVGIAVSGLRNPANRRVSIEGHNTALVDLAELFGNDEAKTGGITVQHSGRPGALQLAGGLEDAVAGFSADLPLTVARAKAGDIGERQYASVGILTNQQDPELGFPSTVKFWPYAFFRNISSTPRALHFAAYYMEGKTVTKLSLNDMTLRPGEAQELAVHDLLAKRPQISDINLTFTYVGDYGDILAATGSADDSGSYVFSVYPMPIAPSGTQASSHWQFGSGFDTMYTIWNPLSTSQDVLANLYYGDKGEQFKLPVHLEPYASVMLDVGEMIRTRQVTPDGNVIPLGVATLERRLTACGMSELG